MFIKFNKKNICVRQIDLFLRFAQEQASKYRTNNIIFTMGGDFTYQYAEMYFKNLDKIIRYFEFIK